MKKILLILGLTLGLSADIGVEFLGMGYHYNKDVDRNSNQKYFGLVYIDEANWEVGISTFENSYYERSNAVYVGYRQPLYEEDFTVGFFVDAGYVSGYEDKNLLLVKGAVPGPKGGFIVINEAVKA